MELAQAAHAMGVRKMIYTSSASIINAEESETKGCKVPVASQSRSLGAVSELCTSELGTHCGARLPNPAATSETQQSKHNHRVCRDD
jgi:hypothetical protein